MHGKHLQEFAEPTASLAAAEERKRLARELHDSLSYTLTISIVQLENATKLMSEEPRQALELIESVRGHLTSGLDDLHQILMSLHNHRIGADNLRDSLRRLIDGYVVATNIRVHTQWHHNLPSVTDTQAVVLYRTVQESLTNSFKHAQAQNIWIRLEIGDDALTLNMKDDGQRFAPSGGRGLGLIGAEERAAQLGGTLHVSRPQEGGVSVTLHLPLKESIHA